MERQTCTAGAQQPTPTTTNPTTTSAPTNVASDVDSTTTTTASMCNAYDEQRKQSSVSSIASSTSGATLQARKQSNFLRKFRDDDTKVLRNLNSAQFMEVWNNYDKDGDGFISGRELDQFLREFVASVSSADIEANEISSKVLADLRQTFLDAYDENLDGKIDIRELAQLLPLEESFLLLFRFDNLLDSSVEFMKIWTNYDKDSSGYIEADELKNFLSDLIKESRNATQVTEDKLLEYTDTILHIFDSNRDGKLQLSEMARLLPVRENFLNRSAFKGASKITKDDIERVFELYDRDQNGCIENEELGGFLKDLLELVKNDYDALDLNELQDAILCGCDFNRDGKINKRELTMVLLALSRHASQERA